MQLEDFRDFCLALPGVTEEFPFDNKTLVFKVAGKMFALCDVETFEGINLKCDPETAILWREQYPAVQPGYHMNKSHWNTLIMDGSLPPKFILKATRLSYDLVVKGLPQKTQKELVG